MRQLDFNSIIRRLTALEFVKAAGLFVGFAVAALVPIAAGLAAPGGQAAGQSAGLLCLLVAIASGVLLVRSAGECVVLFGSFLGGVLSAIYLGESFPLFPLLVLSLFFAISRRLHRRGTFSDSGHKAFLLASVCVLPVLLVEYSKYTPFTRFRFGVALMIGAGIGLVFAGLQFIASARKDSRPPIGGQEGLEDSAGVL